MVVGLGHELIELSEISDFVRNEIVLSGSSAFELKEHKQLLSLVSTGRLDLTDSVTETFPLSKVNAALDRLADSKEDIIRFVVNDFI